MTIEVPEIVVWVVVFLLAVNVGLLAAQIYYRRKISFNMPPTAKGPEEKE